jgi:hypothetical protein
VLDEHRDVFRVPERLRAAELLPLGSRIRRRLVLDYASPYDLLAVAGNPSLTPPETPAMLDHPVRQLDQGRFAARLTRRASAVPAYHGKPPQQMGAPPSARRVGGPHCPDSSGHAKA